MSIGDIVVIFIIVMIVIFALIKTARLYRHGCSSGCDCCDKCKKNK